jgi:peptide/nickel transport system substrate-binding protein
MSNVSHGPVVTRRGALSLVAAAAIGSPARAAAEGQITIAAHVTLAPTWFDPA